MSSKRSMLLLTGIALVVGYSTAAADTLKCPSPIQPPGYDNATPVTLIDGVVRTVEEISEVDVHSVEIVCWDPETGDFVRAKGGVAVVVVMTKDFASSDERVAGHYEAVRKAMRELWDKATGGGRAD